MSQLDEMTELSIELNLAKMQALRSIHDKAMRVLSDAYPDMIKQPLFIEVMEILATTEDSILMAAMEIIHGNTDGHTYQEPAPPEILTIDDN